MLHMLHISQACLTIHTHLNQQIFQEKLIHFITCDVTLKHKVSG